MTGEVQLLGFMADIMQTMAPSSQKYDEIGHKRLTVKMEYYSGKGQTNAWIRDFPAYRSQTVVLRCLLSYKSQERSIKRLSSGTCLFLYVLGQNYCSNFLISMNE